MRRFVIGRWADGVRWLAVGVLLVGGLGMGGCLRHESQMESLRAERIEVAPEQHGYTLAEVFE